MYVTPASKPMNPPTFALPTTAPFENELETFDPEKPYPARPPAIFAEPLTFPIAYELFMRPATLPTKPPPHRLVTEIFTLAYEFIMSPPPPSTPACPTNPPAVSIPDIVPDAYELMILRKSPLPA